MQNSMTNLPLPDTAAAVLNYFQWLSIFHLPDFVTFAHILIGFDHYLPINASV